MRSLRTATTSAATVALAVVLAACGGGSGSPSSDRQNTGATADGAPGKASPKSADPASPSDTGGTSLTDGEVCAKLSADDVAKIVGKPVKATDLMIDVNSPDAARKHDPTICTYTMPKEGDRERWVAIGRIGPPESMTEWSKVENRQHDRLTDEFGAGTQGVDMGSGIYTIHKGDALITFQGIEAGLDDSILKQLARRAVEVL